MTSNAEPKGRIVKTLKDGLPILWTFIPEIPNESDRRALPWRVVISWKYDGSQNNGMPDADENATMIGLDTALGEIEEPMFCFEAYRRIGHGLREFVFYVSSCEAFMEALNCKLETHPRYPIEIKFYDDENWSDFLKLIDDLGAA